MRESFKAKKAEAVKASFKDVELRLEVKRVLAIEEVIRVHKENTSLPERIKTIIALGAITSAEYDLRKNESSNDTGAGIPGWLKFTRNALSSYLADSPLDKQLMESTVFFSPDPQMIDQLTNLAYSSVTPSGNDDSFTVAACLASGLYEPKQYTSPVQ